MPEVRLGPTGTIILDDRYLPLLIATFVGEVGVEQGRWFEKVSLQLAQREGARGRRLVCIHDTSRSTRTSPEMRKFWAEMSARSADTMKTLTLGTIVVITNPLLRGVLTAVGWLDARVAELEVASSMEAALTEASRVLAAAGSPVQVPRSPYRAPEDALASAG